MRKQLFLACVCFLHLVASFAQQNVSLCPDKPKLILLIVVDNLNNQQLDVVRSQVGPKGFNRLCVYGTQLTDAYYEAGGNFAGKNLATLYTGAPAATHGIVSRQWIDSFTGKKVDAIYGDCSDDGKVDTLAKPANGALLCGTIGNEIRKIYNNRAKVFSIGFDPQMLIWSSGTLQGEPFAWVDARSGEIKTSNVTSETTRKWVENFNEKKIPALYRTKIWQSSKVLGDYHESKFFSSSRNPMSHFAHALSVVPPNKLRFSAVCGSPYGNDLVRDIAAAALLYEDMGKDDVPDLLTVQFTAMPAIGDRKQPLDIETEDLLLRLDENIASLLRVVDQHIGMDNTLVVFTSAQGAYDVSATDSPHWGEKGFVSMKRSAALLNLYLMALYGQENWVKTYASGSIYLNRELIEKRKISWDTILMQSSQFLTQVKGIGDAVPAKDLKLLSATTVPAISSMRHNYHPKRSGDILVYLEPGWAEELDDGRRLTQLWNGEFVPLVFYGWKVPQSTIYERHNMTDVAPTICSFIRVGLPNGCSGQPLPVVDHKR